jgi:hypothetical protein
VPKRLESWYEAQYLASDNVWTLWEKFHYDRNSRVAQIGARERAIKAATWCRTIADRPARVMRCSQIETYHAA